MKFLIFASVIGFIVGQSLHRYRGNSDSIVFPGPARTRMDRDDWRDEPSLTGRSAVSSELSTTLEVAKEISSLQTIEEILARIKGAPPMDTFVLRSRLGDAEERSNVEIPKMVACVPEMKTVPIAEANVDSSIMYIPSCTRVKRCGEGCCINSLLSCQATATETRNFQVIVTKFDGELIYKEKKIVPLEEHTKCACECKIKAEDCRERQTYNERECTCSCSNVDEENKCRHSNTKLWDPLSCACLCRASQECSTGFYFDQNTCSCTKIPIGRRWFGDELDTGYNFHSIGRTGDAPPIIITLDAADPRRKQKDDPEFK